MKGEVTANPGVLRTLSLMAAAVFFLLSIGHGDAQAVRKSVKIIKIDGSSTVYPITEALAEEFQVREHGNVLVTIDISGTGGGFMKFCRGETDISNASRPIKLGEVAECRRHNVEYIEIPVAYDGIAVTVNPLNHRVKSLSVEDLKKIWGPEAQGSVTKWSRIRKGWPDRKIHLYGPAPDSGTYDYFTRAIVGEQGSSRSDYTSSENYNLLARRVAADKYALSFFGLFYYINNKDKLKLVAIDDGDPSNGKGAVYPTIETVNNGTYQPLSRPIFIYVSRKAASRQDIRDFVEYYIKNAGKVSIGAGYIPLSAEFYRLAMKRFEQRKTGSVFGGEGAREGVSMSDLMRME
ncbi:MAG: PstS family phosphate ABC transporter substrate-binding protein [Thermodesulfobacteriota bacterium]|nr:MAG: PstS family phosphate ABC transporter substrate-binding protein [Thermodesulfobacteriota bacterium]